MNMPPVDRLGNLRHQLVTARNLALVLATAAGVWRAWQGVDLVSLPAQPGQPAGYLCKFGVQAPCPSFSQFYSSGSAAVPARTFFDWNPSYLMEGLVLAVVVFLAIAALRTAWRSFNSPTEP
jgi:hypothetical protein